jgi:hypothetical protein
VIGTLRDLPELARDARIGPPATLIVGAVAALGHDLAWVGDPIVTAAAAPAAPPRPVA